MLALVGFSDNIVTQISLADKHGNLLGSLTKIETYMLRMTKVRKETHGGGDLFPYYFWVF